MPAQNIVPVDINRIGEIAAANVAMLTTMHGALTEIARCEVSIGGGIAQKHIAETALIRVNKCARHLEVKYA